MAESLTDADMRPLRSFLAFIRAEGLAVCLRVDEPEGPRIWWQPTSRSARHLVDDFSGWMDRHTPDGTQSG